jgi:hypothetical protein
MAAVVLALFAGMSTILAPCTLPVLPGMPSRFAQQGLGGESGRRFVTFVLKDRRRFCVTHIIVPTDLRSALLLKNRKSREVGAICSSFPSRPA